MTDARNLLENCCSQIDVSFDKDSFTESLFEVRNIQENNETVHLASKGARIRTALLNPNLWRYILIPNHNNDFEFE